MIQTTRIKMIIKLGLPIGTATFPRTLHPKSGVHGIGRHPRPGGGAP